MTQEHAQTDLVVHKQITIDMQALVTVGLAKAERMLRAQLKESGSIINELTANVDRVKKQFGPEAERAVPTAIVKARDTLNATYKELKLNRFKAALDIDCDMTNQKNCYTLLMKHTRNTGYGDHDDEIRILEDTCDFTAAQLALSTELEELQEKLDTQRQFSVDTRRKLSDFGALERQIHARVVEQELKKTADGEAILAAAMSQFMDDIKMLGV